MKKQSFVNELSKGEKVEDIFFVKYIAEASGKDGRKYLNAVLSDKSGDLEARKWSGAEEVVKNVTRGDAVSVSGKINVYQNRVQMILDKIEKIELTEELRPQLIAASSQNSAEMMDQLSEIIESLDDIYIKELLMSVINDRVINERMMRWTAGRSIHHAYEGGLLEHVLSCSQLAVSMSEHYKVNKNFVVAGAILHDLCKIYELTSLPVVDYTNEGQLIGHLAKGLELVDRFSSKIADFPRETKMHLKHIILSHHGQLEYGSPKLPLTAEANLVHLIDLMDSKMASILEIKRKDNTPGDWSGFVRHLDRMIYKKDLPTFKTKVLKEKKGEKEKKPLNSAISDQLKGLKID